MRTRNTVLLAIGAYVVYRGLKSGGGAGGPIGVVYAGLRDITAGPPKPGTKVIVVPPTGA